ncbi:polysaccharide biosynthesis protein [Noviherbaspirillum aridicola]|uniref:Membrane protein n=1 Tax=Noviherbaspirillum aridicola TaxID=2849687 RepID=A0ABQ4Q354_9BURK|nr:nucleoside-diphosphate sugar epimerase/dehydratase [Noviherbaspirillum aridicola]GIZ51623.1 membrane protein [Noviherbaspirillum aridicola]
MPLQSNIARLSHRMLSLPRAKKILLMMAADLLALPLCFLGAMLLRVPDLQIVSQYGWLPYLFTPVATVLVLAACGVYGAVIRFIDIGMLLRTGVVLALVIVASFLVASAYDSTSLPRSGLVIYWFIALSWITASRLSVRAFLRSGTGMTASRPEPVGIYGAGETGARLAQALRAEGRYAPVCFFDDKRELKSRNVAGLKVLRADRIGEIAAQTDMRMIVLALPAVSPARRRELVHAIRREGLAVKTVNSLVELSDDAITSRSIRDVKIEDLLGRAPVPPQRELFAACVRGKGVLVTGAGGSIGSELCRQVMTLAPRALHLLDHSEFALYSIEHELRDRWPHVRLHAHLGSVCDAALVSHILRTGAVDTVYHAAAYKHVPVVEANMAEGIRNNVLGAQVIADAARAHEVQTCVLISTDKAVRPTNIMGATKRVAELIFQAAAETTDADGTTYCMVRLGNVLGSSGSVIPLFRRQIESGGPLTITHPDVIRYFMLIPEAAQLVIQAGAMARGGDLFVLDMGEPVRILDLARSMIEMAGMTEKTADNPGGDMEISFIGLRPGEKLYEELLIGDNTRPSRHPRILCANEYSVHPLLLAKLIERLLVIARSNDPSLIRSAIKAIVTEYSPEPWVGQGGAPTRPAAQPDSAYRRLRSRRPAAAMLFGVAVLQTRRVPPGLRLPANLVSVSH